jgi:hypothetical protein
MQSTTQALPISKKNLWAGRVMSALPVMMLLFSGIMKLTGIDAVLEGFARLGYPASLVLGIGIVEIACVVIYLIPRTAILGAILVTGYLGGAVATHVRVGDPFFSQALAPFYLGVLAWGGIYLRDDRVRALIPLRR